MKFSSLLYLGVSLSVIGYVSAAPSPQDDATTPIVYHCGGQYNEKCPLGYRCCGPISVDFGGTCYKGVTGLCPL